MSKRAADVRDGLLYSEHHVWADISGGRARIGITAHASMELKDIVFAELPLVGRGYAKGATLAQVESVKTVAAVLAPMDCTVEEVNSPLADDPRPLNDSPYQEGWIAVARVDRPNDGLMDAGRYREFLKGL